MRCAVTGGAGFIGSYVVDHLLRAGHEVVVLDPREPSQPEAAHLPTDICNLKQLVENLEGVDVVYHLAGYADVGDVAQYPANAVEVNVSGSGNVLEAAQIVQARRVVLASTVWVYDAARNHANNIVDESEILVHTEPRHIYTATKISMEMLAHSYYRMFGLPFTILRYGIPYGPRMRGKMVIARFVEQAAAGQPLTIQGDGRQTRRFLHVDDLANAHVLALDPKAECQTYNCDGAEAISIRRLAEDVASHFPGVEVHFTPARAGDYAGVTVSSAKAERELGWKPEINFADGLAGYVDWHRLASQPAGVQA